MNDRDDSSAGQNEPQVVSEPRPPFPEQRQDRPGLESKLDPRPRYRAERYRAAEKLAGKRALITGGDSGIGRAVAVLYAREGADVAIVYLPDEQSDAEETKRAVEEQGRRCLLLPGDLCDPGFCGEAVERTARELGGLNILVSNAAYLVSKTRLEQLTAEDWDRTFKTNAYAYFHLVMAALPHLGAGDSVIATASEDAISGSSIMMDYAASKAAMVAFTKSIAPHLIERGVRANVVVPGQSWTALNVADHGQPTQEIINMGSATQLTRPGQPEEIAPTYVFLASDADSSFITGEVIAVTGGMTTTR
ncbi:MULTISPECIES: SDR family oxidoreductase [Actinomadura]|uniref:SDR family oxidoreductase n=1 Tax=Actinomadura yumaensis TaxID=111807 RepID=A0ABW2CV61_9ACTN|nr:SDR family oxidoreductase [Actinomadura sp. J1-007]MWK34088.1 SDR family oxidoreductase [Actinomadura sp. J1-007]